MQINDLSRQKFELGKSFSKAYDELFSGYIKKLGKAEKTGIKTIQQVSSEFNAEYKTIRNAYETKKFELEVKETPSLYTMTSAVNRHRDILNENMDKRLKAARKELEKNLNSNTYDFAQKNMLKKQYLELEASLKEEADKKISTFRGSYYDALTRKDNNAISRLHTDILSNLLSEV